MAAQVAGFALVAGLVRLIVRHVESRWQIVAFCLVAVLLEILSARRGGHSSGLRLLLRCAGAAAIIVTVKLVLEPFVVPEAVHNIDVHGVRHTARSMVHS